MANMVEIGSGYLRKGVIDSIVKRRGDPFIWKTVMFTYCREEKLIEAEFSYDFVMDACGIGEIYVRFDLFESVNQLCRELFGKTPELVVKLNPCSELWQQNFTLYLKGITVEEFVMLKLAVE